MLMKFLPHVEIDYLIFQYFKKYINVHKNYNDKIIKLFNFGCFYI